MPKVKEQLALGRAYEANGKAELRDAAAADNKALPVHRWVPWIAGFSAGFVEDAIDAYLPARNRARQLVLDPFAGVGTTLVEAVKAGCDTVGYEINAFAALAARAKLDCIDVAPDALEADIDAFRGALTRFESRIDHRYGEAGSQALDRTLSKLRAAAPPAFRSRIPFFSPPVEAKFLFALEHLADLPDQHRQIFLAAFGATMVTFSNYSYEPSLSSRPGADKPLVENASVSLPVCRKLDLMLEDIRWVHSKYGPAWRRVRRGCHPWLLLWFEAETRHGIPSCHVSALHEQLPLRQKHAATTALAWPHTGA